MRTRIIKRFNSKGDPYYNAQYVDPDTGLWETLKVCGNYMFSSLSGNTKRFESEKQARKALREKKTELTNSQKWIVIEGPDLF